MKSHTDLLNTLIDALYAAPPSPEIHRYQILAAEIRGEMQATDDGWVENTGVMPECEIIPTSRKQECNWLFSSHLADRVSDITHYKPL
jgi:hypothetical protein